MARPVFVSTDARDRLSRVNPEMTAVPVIAVSRVILANQVAVVSRRILTIPVPLYLMVKVWP